MNPILLIAPLAMAVQSVIDYRRTEDPWALVLFALMGYWFLEGSLRWISYLP